MKILKVIHGYPMRYNAGSEVYSQTLCHGLADKHEGSGKLAYVFEILYLRTKKMCN